MTNLEKKLDDAVQDQIMVGGFDANHDMYVKGLIRSIARYYMTNDNISDDLCTMAILNDICIGCSHKGNINYYDLPSDELYIRKVLKNDDLANFIDNVYVYCVFSRKL